MQEYVYVNSRLVPKEHALLPVNDLALLRGYGVFDFFLLVRGLPLYFEDHWKRLNHSAAFMHINVPFSREELLDMIAGLYEKMPLPFGGIRVTLTGGSSPDGYTPSTQPNSIITLQPLPAFAPDIPSGEFSLMTHEYRRAMPLVKSIDYAVGILMQQVGKEKGYRDVLYVQNGWVSECPRSNIFAVTKDRVLITPDGGILQGITRLRVLNLAKDTLNVEVRPVLVSELLTADEVFITSTTRGVLPVSRIDDIQIGKGSPGDVSRMLYAGLKAQLNG